MREATPAKKSNATPQLADAKCDRGPHSWRIDGNDQVEDWPAVRDVERSNLKTFSLRIPSHSSCPLD